MPEKNSSILDKIIKGSIYALAFLMPLFFLPFGTGSLGFQKQILLLFLSMIGLGALLLKVLVKKGIHVKRTPLNYVILFLLLVFGASTVYSWDVGQSFFGSIELASSGLLSWLCLASFFFLVVNSFDSIEEVKHLVYLILGSSFLAGLFGFIQMWGQFVFPWNFTQSQSFNTIGSTNSLSLFMGAVLPLVITLFLVKKDTWLRMGLGVLGVLSFLVMVLANYWIVWLCLAVGMMGLIVFLKITPARTDDSWVILPVVLLVIAFSFALIQPDIPGLPTLPGEVSPSYGSVLGMGRKIVTGNQGAVRALIGTGPATFSSVYRLFKPAAISKTVFWSVNFQNAPSQMLGLLATTGLLGVLSMFALIVTFGTMAVKVLIGREKGKFAFNTALRIGLFSGWLILAAAKFVYPSALVVEFLFWSLMAFFIISVFIDK